MAASSSGDGADPGAAAMRQVLGRFASGVVVVSGSGSDGPVGFTCQSFFSLSLDPPLVALAPSRSSATWPHLHRSALFTANVLRDGQADLARSFSRTGVDKFAGVAWVPGPTGTPHLQGALAWIDCRVEQVHAGGDHHLVVGRVLQLAGGDGRPLVFYRGRFASLER